MKMTAQISMNNKGSALIVTLILLMILTMIAVMEVTSHTSDTKIVTNTANHFVALQTAEGTLNQVANQLLQIVPAKNKFAMNADGYYLLNPNNPPIWTTINWQSAASVIFGYQGESIAPSAYIIEMLPSIVLPGSSTKNPTNVYRVTIRSVGKTNDSVVYLQCIIEISSL